MQEKYKYLQYGALAAIVLAIIFLLFAVYYDVKNRTMDDFSAQQLLLAYQAANSIEETFTTFYNELSHLAIMYNVKVVNNWGVRILENYYKINANKILAVSRMNAQGTIIYSYPPNPNAQNSDITKQEHVKLLLETKEPVISDVFTSVQGYSCIAYHVPVFTGNEFDGSLAVLIPFQHLAKTHLEKIKKGNTNSIWIMSEKGIELYCQHENHIQNNVLDNTAHSPTALKMINQMKKGFQGSSIYTDSDGESRLSVFCPVKLGNTFWSINISTPTKQVLANMSSFQTKLFLITGALLVLGIVTVYYYMTAFKIVKEEEKRKKIENALKESEEKFRELADLLPQMIYETDAHGEITYANNHAYDTFGYTEEDVKKGLSAEMMIAPQDRPKAKQNLYNLLNGKILHQHNEYMALHKNGSTFPVLIYSSTIIRNGELQGLRGILIDISERKKFEEQLERNLLEKEILLKEIHHRVKNNLNVISSLLTLQASKITDKKDALAAFKESRNRIYSIAQVHEQLYKSNDFTQIDMKSYIRTLSNELANIYAKDKNIQLELIIKDDIYLDVNRAVPCGLILNELVTNAFKHAFPDTTSGKLLLNFYMENKHYVIHVKDNGIGMPHGKKYHDSLGMQLVSILTKQIEGSMEIENKDGAHFTIQFPV